MKTWAPYGTVKPVDSWSHKHRTPTKTFLCSNTHTPREKPNGIKYALKQHFTPACSLLCCLHRSNYQHMPTTWWLEVMQMQLVSICIRQQLMDAQMADNRDAPSLAGWKTGGHFVWSCAHLDWNNHTALLWRRQQFGSSVVHTAAAR